MGDKDTSFKRRWQFLNVYAYATIVTVDILQITRLILFHIYIYIYIYVYFETFANSLLRTDASTISRMAHLCFVVSISC